MSNRSDFFVIGAGFGRTGTTSLKEALEILYKRPCYHMHEVMRNNHTWFWNGVARGERRDFDTVLGKFASAVDFPSAMYWEDMTKYYPKAKVILTVRDPESWYKSAIDTILRMFVHRPLGFAFLMALPLKRMRESKEFRNHLHAFFNEDVSKDACIKRFNEWNAQVKATCPKDKLLVYKISEGWEPLCKFLEVPVPDVPFPHVNDTKEFHTRMRIANYVGYGVMFTLTTVVAVGASYVLRYFS